MEAQNVKICGYFLGFHEQRHQPLPVAIGRVLGEFCTFPLLDRGLFKEAWTLEQQNDVLSTLLGRGGADALELTAAVLALHDVFDEDRERVRRDRDVLEARFWPEKVEAALERHRKRITEQNS